MHHGVDVAVADHLGDNRISDVGADELGPAHPSLQILARCDRINGDDVIDRRILHQPRGEITAEESAGAGDQNHPGVIHGNSLSADTADGAVRGRRSRPAPP